MTNTQNKSRMTLNDVQKMLDGMSMEVAEKVHVLFMANYIDYSDYEFRDEWQVDDYIYCYNDFYECGGEECLRALNQYVVSFLEEWREDAESIYRKAKSDICYWMTCEWRRFESSMQKEIEKAASSKTAIKSASDMAKALLPYPSKIAERIKDGAYEEAAGDIYCILECLAKAYKEHEDWFGGLLEEGTYTDLTEFTETLVELYCHLRHLPELPRELADEMNIQIEVFNKKTGFFGDMMCDSRFSDMVCDRKSN